MATVKAREYISMEVALLLSLALHLLAYACWMERDFLARIPILKPFAKVFAPPLWSPPRQAAKPVPTITFVEMPEPKRPEPRTFMETDASQVTGEEPTDAKYYSDRSTVAANPENPTGKFGDTPYLEGKEAKVMSTEDVTPSPNRSAPAPAAVLPPPKPVELPKPVVEKPPEQSQPKLADEGRKAVEEQKVAMLEKPAPSPPPVAAPVAMPEPPPTPAAPAGSDREIAARKSRAVAAGVSRQGVAAFNVAGSPFGEYDKALIRAVQSRWYALIYQNGLYERSGTVTLHFYLLADGSVKDMEFKDNTAGEILGLFCQKAVVDSSPFAPLPESLRILIGNDPREVNFTFYY
jgi:outer membrane biosynthesis protein TonB